MPAQLVRLQPAPDLVDQVYRALLGAISSGTLAPGERITQEDIAQRLLQHTLHGACPGLYSPAAKAGAVVLQR